MCRHGRRDEPRLKEWRKSAAALRNTRPLTGASGLDMLAMSLSAHDPVADIGLSVLPRCDTSLSLQVRTRLASSWFPAREIPMRRRESIALVGGSAVRTRAAGLVKVNMWSCTMKRLILALLTGAALAASSCQHR